MGTYFENKILQDNRSSLKVIIDEIKDAVKSLNKNYIKK